MNNTVAVAHEHAMIAQKVYDDYVEDYLNNPDDPLNWTEIGRLGKIANDADRRTWSDDPKHWGGMNDD